VIKPCLQGVVIRGGWLEEKVCIAGTAKPRPTWQSTQGPHWAIVQGLPGVIKGSESHRGIQIIVHRDAHAVIAHIGNVQNKILGQRAFQGKVREVRNNSTTSNNVVTYPTIITVSNEDLKLRPGMTADVSVLSDERGRFVLQDNEKTQVVAERLLQPQFCLRAGKRYDANATILPEAVAA